LFSFVFFFFLLLEKEQEFTKEKKVLQEKMEEINSTLKHRFYENEFPILGEIVMVKVVSLNDYCAFVSLLEYNCLKGAIQFTELSSKRIRTTPHKILAVGKMEPLSVIRIDVEKKYIDLTRKNISKDEIRKCNERWTIARTLHSIASHIVEVRNEILIDDVYNNLIFPLWKSERYENPLFFFEAVLSDFSKLDSFNISQSLKETLIKDISHRLAKNTIKVQAIIEMTCFTAEGVDAIIPALRAGRNADQNIHISIISAPLYAISINNQNVETGIKILFMAIEVIKLEIEKKQGSLQIRSAPEAVSLQN